MADVDYLKFFKDEILNESATIRIGAVNKIHLIASALGEKRVVDELLPYLGEVVKEDPFKNDEEFLFTVAKQYSTLQDYVGNSAPNLIPTLEYLAAQEETVIRDEAIKSLCTIVQKKPDLAKEHLVPAVHRLSQRPDFFTARVSACGLLPTTYYHSAEDQKEALRKAYTSLCQDDTPMVRRAAANKMRDFMEVCKKPNELDEMISVYVQLSQEDTQDTIRVACVNTTLVIAESLRGEHQQKAVKVISDAAEDRSWRVRLTVAKNFDKLCAGFGKDIVASDLIKAFLKLLVDNEQEVRKETIKIIEPCLEANHFSNDQFKDHILPQFQSLGNDAAQPVRAALAQILGPVAKSLGKDVTTRELTPLIQSMMKDEFHDVRLNIVGHAGLLCSVLGRENVSEPPLMDILQQIQSLIMDNHWRIRRSVVTQVPMIAQQFGVELFQAKLEALFLASLRDSVHSVRAAAIDELENIAKAFGAEWAHSHLLPKIEEQYSQNAGYANRVTTLHVLPKVAVAMTPDKVGEKIIPLIIRGTKDAVPNVRFSACRTLMNMNLSSNTPQVSQLQSALKELEGDSDLDVQYYAAEALKAIQK